ncbi:hypothetical protein [Leptospira weilii]|uniref:hypothetical protein n=1 Tax=Leptospira weilii TaxID=28184 RepID=UPI000A9476B1|nr:hypothetical protein [Leptospira weilii]
MGRRIVKQPNGKFAMWSTYIDDFIQMGLTKEESSINSTLALIILNKDELWSE